ncbi:hypothetical protein V2J09_006748 [Rumex salicifolius]
MLLSSLSRRTLEADSRDSYGFTVRPQHLEIYGVYNNIYKEEEEERSEKWNNFLEQYGGTVQLSSPTNVPSEIADDKTANEKTERISENCPNGNNCKLEMEIPLGVSSKSQTWIPIRPPLSFIEKMMGVRFKNKAISNEYNNPKNLEPCGTLFPCKEELEFLVRGGVPKHLRGEIWQAFTGVQTRYVDKYYQNLVSSEMDSGNKKGQNGSININDHHVPEKIKKQIEKDLSRTFPGHPALTEDGRNSLRRILIAYARHNPSVGYCQAMNFFAGLFLLLMPEENAFWALVGIIDDYFDGYYTYEMIESQVDQLVFEELMREKFPKLVNHLDYLGVQVTWITSPWFISIFVNMLPWETVLRIWDVLLFEGNRVMLFRSVLALMELYGPVIITTKDSGEAMTLLQSFAASTFDSSQLVITACMSFLQVTEDRLQVLRNKHRPSVLAIIEERTRGSQVSKESKSIATKLSSFKHGPQGVMKMTQESGLRASKKNTFRKVSSVNNFDEFLCNISTCPEKEYVPDLQEQVDFLKLEISNLLEEKRLATVRADELEIAFMEMVKQDNRKQLSARVEQLEHEVAELQKILDRKQQQETKMLEVLMRVEQKQRVSEDARLAAEHEVAAQRYAVHLLQEKYEKTLAALAKMEKKVVMAESTLEATLQYQSGQAKALSSPRGRQDSLGGRFAQQSKTLKFGLGWLDKNKGKPRTEE